MCVITVPLLSLMSRELSIVFGINFPAHTSSDNILDNTTCFKNCGRGEGLRAATCLKTVLCISKDMVYVEYFCSNDSFLHHSSIMKIMRLSQC